MKLNSLISVIVTFVILAITGIGVVFFELRDHTERAEDFIKSLPKKIKDKFVLLAMKILGASWKTSLFGYTSAIIYGIVQALTQGTLTVRDMTIQIIIAIGGRLQKDFDKTGT